MPTPLTLLNGLVVALLASTASASPTALQARGRRYLGGVSMTLACAVENGDTAWIDVFSGSGAGGWKCRKGDREPYEWRSINVNAACVFQYDEPNAYGENNRGDKYGWGCYMN